MKYPEIRDAILEMVRIDQEMRLKMMSGPVDSLLWSKVDTSNTEQLVRTISQIGWPTISKVGNEASKGAWLLAQHADQDVNFQKQCLQLMTKELPTEVSEINIAYLYDRICVNEGRPQFFGTQFTNNTYGAYGPQPIELFEFVDERRKAIGLKPLVEYKQQLKQKYKEK